MKKSNIILIIQLIGMYLIHLPLCLAMIIATLPNVDELAVEALFVVSIVVLSLMIPVCIVSIALGCIHFAHTKASPLKTAMIVKLCLIPWYVLSFLISVMLVVGFLNPWLMLAIPLLIVCEVAVTYFFMLSTSIHSIAYTVRYLVTNKLKPNAATIVALVFHLLFCLDVVGAIMLNVEHEKRIASNAN